MADDYRIVAGGCAANAAIAAARLGASARFVGPLGDMADPASNEIVATLAHERVKTSGVARVPGASAPVSGILLDASGERMIATFRDRRIEAARPTDLTTMLAGVDVVLADNRFPDFVRPVCEHARERGIPVVLDADRPTMESDPLFVISSHVVFSSECLRATTEEQDLSAALVRFLPRTSAFLAVSDGPNDIHFIASGEVRRLSAFTVDAIDTLAAGDVFHAGFAVALAEGMDAKTALRFGAAAAALKCTRFGGSSGAPTREEVNAFLA